jgi:hypothetical protein
LPKNGGRLASDKTVPLPEATDLPPLLVHSNQKSIPGQFLQGGYKITKLLRRLDILDSAVHVTVKENDTSRNSFSGSANQPMILRQPAAVKADQKHPC